MDNEETAPPDQGGYPIASAKRARKSFGSTLGGSALKEREPEPAEAPAEPVEVEGKATVDEPDEPPPEATFEAPDLPPVT